jgi:VIT1/CCC1 family predicted Fe2+/Mn2+ transporter
MDKVERWSQGLLSRIIGTIIAFAGFLVGSLIYVGFYAKGHNAFQDFVVVAVALIIALAAIAIMWVTFAGRRGLMIGKWGP